jgi:hypothetical protein
MKNSIQFPVPKKIDYTKFIEPKKQIFETVNGVTTANLTTSEKSIFEQLHDKTKNFVKHYATDFKHDKKSIEENPGAKFVHIARSTGTSLSLFRTDLSQFPKKGEMVPYLFGTAGRERILKDSVFEIEYYSQNNGNDELYKIHYFDGNRLIEIDFKKAVELKNQYINNVLQIWENEK